MGNIIELKSKKADEHKLIEYGFSLIENEYKYSVNLCEGQFFLTVRVFDENKIKTKLIDKSSDEVYTLHLLPAVKGAFIGKIKEEYDDIIEDIISNCFVNDVFKSEYAKKVIKYIRKKYNDNEEYLWEKFSDNAVFRRKDSMKWYAVLLIVSKDKLGLKSSEKIEIMDLRIEPEALNKIVDNKKYFRGYHVNKKHWLTVMIEPSIDINEIYKRIDDSYELAKK